jgi:hypothetical protein
MAFNVKIDSFQKGGDPTRYQVGVTYTDDATPDWRISKTIELTLDPAATPAAQRTAIQSQLVADATPYKQQLAVEAALKVLPGFVGSTFTV